MDARARSVGLQTAESNFGFPLSFGHELGHFNWTAKSPAAPDAGPMTSWKMTISARRSRAPARGADDRRSAA